MYPYVYHYYRAWRGCCQGVWPPIFKESSPPAPREHEPPAALHRPAQVQPCPAPGNDCAPRRLLLSVAMLGVPGNDQDQDGMPGTRLPLATSPRSKPSRARQGLQIPHPLQLPRIVVMRNCQRACLRRHKLCTARPSRTANPPSLPARMSASPLRRAGLRQTPRCCATEIAPGGAWPSQM